jgi:hypothetical protein
MDHKGAHEGNAKYNDPVKLFATIIATALGATRQIGAKSQINNPQSIPPSDAGEKAISTLFPV